MIHLAHGYIDVDGVSRLCSVLSVGLHMHPVINAVCVDIDLQRLFMSVLYLFQRINCRLVWCFKAMGNVAGRK
jgi:hypothetical protein